MDVTSADRAQWAAEALAAYNDQAPRDVLSLQRAERVRLGILAAEALARATRYDTAAHVVDDSEVADEVIGDLMHYTLHLASDRITPAQLIQAAEEIRNPTLSTVATVLMLAAHEVERVAAMLAAVMDAADAFGCDVATLLARAQGAYEADVATEAGERARP